MSTSAISGRPTQSRWPVWAFALLGAAVGALLVVSETATKIHADRDHLSPYRFTVSVFGFLVHESAVATTEELRPRMQTWGYTLITAFAAGGGLLGAALGWGCCRRNIRLRSRGS